MTNAGIGGTERSAEMRIGLPGIGGNIRVRGQARYKKVHGIKLGAGIDSPCPQAERGGFGGREACIERCRDNSGVLVLVALA